MGNKCCFTIYQKHGYYKLFDNPKDSCCFKIENKFDLHTKVIEYIRKFHKIAIVNCNLGEL